jgi:hypothetical protein
VIAIDFTQNSGQNSVTSFIAHQAVLLRNDMAKMQMSADEKRESLMLEYVQ